MNHDAATARPAILPPRGLFLALLCQLPAAALQLPLRPSLTELGSGLTLIVLGIAINVWADFHFKRMRVQVCPFGDTPACITSGPFALTRNPMYLGLLAISAGVTLATGALSNLWISAAFAIWLHYAYVLPEEAFLRDRLGREYLRYATRVPRWLIDVDISRRRQ